MDKAAPSACLLLRQLVSLAPEPLQSSVLDWQVTKSAKQAQQRKAKGAVTYDDAPSAAPDAPRRWTDYTVHFAFPEPPDVGSASLIQLMDVDFKYPGREDFGLQGLNIGIDMGSRVAIVGPNGAGKTTLMNLLGGVCRAGGGQSWGVSGGKCAVNGQNLLHCCLHHNLAVKAGGSEYVSCLSSLLAD